MAGQICFINYGGQDSKEILNTPDYARRLSEGLGRIAKMLVDPATVFLPIREFKPGDPNNTWVHLSLLTDAVDSTSIASSPTQFNVHLLIKYITDSTDFAGGLTTADNLDDDLKDVEK